MTKKDALLMAAKDLFGRHGYTETTFKKISDQAGVALGLLAHHYGTKEKLFFTAGMDVLENLFTYVESRILHGENGLEKVMLFCRAYLDFSVAEGSHYLLLIRCSPYTVTGKEELTALHQEFGRIHNLLESHIEQGIKDGSIAGVVPADAAQVVMSTLIGGCRTHLFTPFAKATLYEDILVFIEKGLRAV